jgi:hypothetical protein
MAWCLVKQRDNFTFTFYSILVGRPKWKRPFGRRRRRWEDNIRKDLRKIGWEVVDWIHVVQDRDQWRALLNTVTNVRIAQKAGNFLTS